MSAGRRRASFRTRTRARWARIRRRVQPILLLAAAVVVGSITTLVLDTREARTETAVVTEQRDQVAEQAVNLATQIQVACRDGELDGPVCQRAAEVVADPIPPANGTDGEDGADGRGITGTSIINGRLVIAYTDGTRQDVGVVVGASGAPGVGVAATTIEDGDLIVVYTDGNRVNVGAVVGPTGAQGPTGRGIASVAAQDGRLIVTYTDGTTEDAGPLPRGATGDTGAQGEPAPSVQSETRTFSDGSVERCTRAGGPDSDPQFDCDRTPAPNPEPSGGGLGLIGG